MSGTAPSYLTFDGSPDATVPPYRPGVLDFDGDTLEDDLDRPPTPGQHPTAGGWNQFIKQIVALARVAPSARLSVTFPSGAPVVVLVGGLNGGLVSGHFTPTDNANGDTTITVTSGKLPARIRNPRGLTLIGSTAPTTARSAVVEVVSELAIRVRTYDGNTLTNIPFEIDWD